MGSKKSTTQNPTQQLSITLPADLAEWVSLQAKLRRLTATELVVKAIWHYRDSGLDARLQITKAISKGTQELKTGHYET